METVYEDTCVLHCTDNDQELTVDVMDFRPERYLKVSIEKQIPLNMQYQERFNNYVGSVAGREFTTFGPQGRNVNRTRHF